MLFAICLIRARQDSPGEGRGGVWGKKLQPSHCINWGLPQISGWSPAVEELLESWCSLNGRFSSLLLRMFLFLALALLSSAALPSSAGGSAQLSLLRSCTGDPWKHQARSKRGLSFIPSSSPAQTDSPRLWWIITSSFQAVVAAWIKIYLRILTIFSMAFKTAAPRSFVLL